MNSSAFCLRLDCLFEDVVFCTLETAVEQPHSGTQLLPGPTAKLRGRRTPGSRAQAFRPTRLVNAHRKKPHRRRRRVLGRSRATCRGMTRVASSPGETAMSTSALEPTPKRQRVLVLSMGLPPLYRNSVGQWCHGPEGDSPRSCGGSSPPDLEFAKGDFA